MEEVSFSGAKYHELKSDDPKWFSMIDKVYSPKILSLAWQKVRSNADACGVDGITIPCYPLKLHGTIQARWGVVETKQP